MEPNALSLVVAMMLIIWGCYVFSGAGLLKPLPLLKPSLVWISIIFTLRACAFIPVYLLDPQQLNTQIIASSLICLFVALT